RVDCFATFKKVDEALDGHTGAAEAGRAAHALRIHPDGLVQTAFLFSSHNPKISYISHMGKSNAGELGSSGLRLGARKLDPAERARRAGSSGRLALLARSPQSNRLDRVTISGYR